MTREYYRDTHSTTVTRMMRIRLIGIAGKHGDIQTPDKHSQQPDTYPSYHGSNDIIAQPRRIDRQRSAPETDGHERLLLHKEGFGLYLPTKEPGVGSILEHWKQQDFPQTDPHTSIRSNVHAIASPQVTEKRALWRVLAQSPLLRTAIGLLIGILMLALVLSFINLSDTLRTLQKELSTPRGIFFACLASLSFMLAFVFRALRWRLFLNPVKQVSRIKVVQLFLVGVFLNFLLPIRIGELAKCLVLKRTEKIDIGRSLPTITMDKIFDLLPAIFVIVLAPLLGEKFDIKLWSVLLLSLGILVGVILFVALMAWKRELALSLLHTLTKFLPGKLGEKIEGFATGFVDSLLASVKHPRIFLQAALLTSIAVSLDGLYNMFGFWTIGYPISFAQAVFGYMLFNLFYILPNPPGQVGSNEVVGLLIFSGLLGIPPEVVTAEIIFYHAWSALMMSMLGMGSLSALGVTLSHAMKMQKEDVKAR